MIAQVVFDLPVDGPFDYLIPPSLESQVAPGQRARVFLGRKKCMGLVTGLLQTSHFQNLKPIKTVVDQKPLLDQAQMDLSYELSRYYGCSLGEALFTMVRAQVASPTNAQANVILSPKGEESQDEMLRPAKGGDINRTSSRGRLIIAPTLHLVPSGDYEPILISLINPLVQENKRALVLVPDQFILSAVEHMLRSFPKESYIIGTRSLVFRSLSDIALVVMIDEENPSYKQEQTPMYETRDVLLMRAKNENIRIAFVSTAPSVELMHWVSRGAVGAVHEPPVHGAASCGRPNLGGHGGPPVQVVDLNNYKVSSRWFLSPPVLVALESNLTKKINSMVVINHTLGLQQLQKTLQEKFPSAKICVFKRDLQMLKGDIWIGTSALLRFKYQTRAGLVALLDIDGELNRLQMRSCFRAWSLARHFRTMAQNQFLIQTRHRNHYVMKSLTADDDGLFYAEDMRIRQELGLSPFGHQIAIYVRSVQEKLAQKTAQELYQVLASLSSPRMQVHAPVPEVTARKGRQYRLNILLQGPDVIGMIAFIKQARTKIKSSGKVFVTFNVDP